MKIPILCTTIAALFAALPLARAEQKTTTSSASSTVTAGADGTATVTIEVDGKKETRTFKLGEDKPLVITGTGTLNVNKDLRPAGKETWIGIGLGGAISEELRAQLPIQAGEGVRVAHVAPESPAAKAGLATHDILVRMDDQVLLAPEQFKKLVKMRRPGETAKISFIRKGEQQETSVTFGEHEAAPENASHGVLRLLTEGEANLPDTWPERLQMLREKSGALKGKLKEAKEKYPGIVVDSQAFVLGVDGTVKKIQGELQNMEEIMKTLREQLENANIPPETIEQVRKALEGAIDQAGDAARKAAVEALRGLREKNGAEKPASGEIKIEAQSQPAPPPPPIKAP